jgi:CubicO group peptidase (beta-lactamase class C family)
VLATAIDTNGLPSADPATVGMSAARLAAVDRVVKRGISAGIFPGAAVAIGRDGYAVLSRGYGRLEWKTSSPAVDADESIYDLASLTKVIGTTTAAMVLFDQGKLPLDAPVKRFLPEFAGGLKDKVTIRMLLTHTSGLPAGALLEGRARSPAHAKQLVMQSTIHCTPGACFNYSDVGMATLGWVIERVSGEPLNRFLERTVFGPLRMRNTFFLPDSQLHARIAPTADYSKRKHMIRGEVHDENSYLLGGVAGHAGLFSTAADLSVFAEMMLNRGEINGTRIVADSTVRLFTTEHRFSRALGWEMSDSVHGAGWHLSERAYGHTGFTGTSIWIDPDREMFIVVLANRTYRPQIRRPGDAMADVRNDIADVATFSITADPVIRARAMPVAFRSDTAKSWDSAVRPKWRTALENRRPTNRPAAGAQ